MFPTFQNVTCSSVNDLWFYSKVQANPNNKKSAATIDWHDSLLQLELQLFEDHLHSIREDTVNGRPQFRDLLQTIYNSERLEDERAESDNDISYLDPSSLGSSDINQQYTEEEYSGEEDSEVSANQMYSRGRSMANQARQLTYDLSDSEEEISAMTNDAYRAQLQQQLQYDEHYDEYEDDIHPDIFLH
jgi:hypothetical protein